MKTFILSTLFTLACLMPSQLRAQIGYQVSLLNTATGEPQANKTVNVNIAITNAEDEIVYTEIQTATTNDFGILSLSVGNENTFKNADWNKLPFYISVTADGTLIGKSQILTVPVAEYAKTAGTVLTKDMLVGTWSNSHTLKSAYGEEEITESYNYVTFNEDGSGTFLTAVDDAAPILWKIIGSQVYIYITMEYNYRNYGDIVSTTEPLCIYKILTYDQEENKLICIGGNPTPGIYSKE